MGNFESTESFSTATGASAVAATTPATARTHTTHTTHTTAVAATSPTNTTARTPKTATRKRTVEATNSPAFETPAPQDNEWLQIYSPSRTPAVGRFRDSEFYLDGKVLGQGSFARVQLATHLPTAKKVAVKVIDKTRIPENMRAYAAREPGVLCNLKHPNVVKLLHTSESEREINIFLQFMEGCDMHSYIEQHRFLEEQEARRLFVQIVDAVQYIHKQNVCHRDLKLENILVSKSKRNGAHRAMVIDFGFASVIPSADHLFTDHPGSVCYAAPELLRGDAYDGRKVDVYALGVTLFTMLHGRYPFYSTDNKKLYEMIWKDIPQCAIDLSEPVRQLVMWMLDKNPRSRPTMEQVKSHPWMSGVLNPYTATRSEAIASPINRLKKTISKRLSPQTPRRRLFQ